MKHGYPRLVKTKIAKPFMHYFIIWYDLNGQNLTTFFFAKSTYNSCWSFLYPRYVLILHEFWLIFLQMDGETPTTCSLPETTVSVRMKRSWKHKRQGRHLPFPPFFSPWRSVTFAYLFGKQTWKSMEQLNNSSLIMVLHCIPPFF